MNGIVIIDKASGMTSHDVVNRVRRILGQRSVGHLGTLDPAATGVTNGSMLKGVRRTPIGAATHSVVMRSESGTIRYIEAEHNFALKPDFARFAR